MSGTRRDALEAIENEAERLRAAVLAAYRTFGNMTPDECAARVGRSVLTIRPRCTELKQLGHLRETDERRRNASGRSACVLELCQTKRQRTLGDWL